MYRVAISDGATAVEREFFASNACEGVALARKLARGRPFTLWSGRRRLLSVQKPAN